jgi:riboflavin kinase
MDELLLFLAEKGAVSAPINLTTKEIGSALSMSQQNASVRLKKLCEGGILKKSEKGISITSKGKEELHAVYLKLESLFGEGELSFSGKIVHGRDEGRAFLSIPGYRQGIKKLLGFEPFLGTLNVEIGEAQLEKRIALRERRGLILEGFHHEGKTYGMVEFYRCKVNGLDGALIFPFRTHHGLKILEIISPYDLKETLKLREGSEVRIEVALK